MCGIAGIVAIGGGRPAIALAAVERMCDALHHRGPDDRGGWVSDDGSVALGHTRLAVIDLSPRGRQPMATECGRFRIVFNGEIYNFRDLRRRLDEERRVAWRSGSDTETLLVACQRWGVEESVRRCNGMFAFALWDSVERRLWLARDRFGEKPLYYAASDSRLVFASELKALRAAALDAGDALDPVAVAQVVRFGYIAGERSAFLAVRRLAAGHVLAMTPAGLEPPRAYWRLEDAYADGDDRPFRGDRREAADELERLLLDSVRIRLESDVPLGGFLSGGMDSSLVLALMQRLSPRRVRSFTIGFREPAYDESAPAAAVAERLGTEHATLEASVDQCLELVPSLAEIYDEPFADPSELPTILLARLARRHVTVALSGDGGDELFGGYWRYGRAEAAWHATRLIPRPLRRTVALACGAGRVGSLREDARARLGGWLERERFDAAYADIVSSPGWRDVLADPAAAVAGFPPERRADGEATAAGRLRRMCLVDGCTYLADDILVKVDRATMSVALEGRIPLLDHRIAEFAASLPAAYKRAGGRGKVVLRDVLLRHLPAELVDRPKRGFAAPVGEWLRGGLRAWAEELLSERSLAGNPHLRGAGVRAAWHEHVAGRHDHGTLLWHVLAVQAWMRRWRSGA